MVGEVSPGQAALEQPRTPVDHLLRPFQRFAKLESSGGLVLLISALTAILLANSPWSGNYARLWQTVVRLDVGGYGIGKPIVHWINDGLMAVFFLVVGLEIKREILVGELASIKRASLPIMAAIGGMIFPALLYYAINRGTPAERGWGVPMATDIAFSLGVLALLGSRVPAGLKVFLAAFAIADDLGAILVIALFYTSSLSWISLGIGFLAFAALIVAGRMGVRSFIVYILLGTVLWLALLKSGVHATIAGVLLAMAIPARSRIPEEDFSVLGHALMHEYNEGCREPDFIEACERRQIAVEALEKACENVQTPLQRMENAFHGWVIFLVMPLFALANAGVELGSDPLKALAQPVTVGVAAGLIFGKQIGITLFSWLAVRSGMADLPNGMGWRHVYGVSWLAGIGFTMSLFISELAFRDPHLVAGTKVGILIASLVSGCVGYGLLLSARGNSIGLRGRDAPVL